MSRRRHTRESNFELLRLIAMFMVLMLHVNFASDKFHWPQAFHADPVAAWTRAAFEYAAIPAVDIFVMISGWFRIRANRRGLLSYLLQILYFVIIGAAISLLLTGNLTPFLPSNLWQALWAPWFVPTYLLLYLISPILNAYLDSVTPRQAILTTLLLYLTGWLLSLTTTLDPFQGGYNLLTFIILYLLAAALRPLADSRALANNTAAKGRAMPLIVVIVATLLNLLAFRSLHQPWVWSYANPLIILQAAALLLMTAKTDTANWPDPIRRAINATAGSAFAVYLLHMNPNLFGPCFKTWAQTLWTTQSGPLLILTLLLYILLWYTAALLLDQPRRLLSGLLRRSGPC